MINKFDLNFENWVFWFLGEFKEKTRQDLEVSFCVLEEKFHKGVDKKICTSKVKGQESFELQSVILILREEFI